MHRLDAVHLVEDLLQLYLHLYANVLTDLFEVGADGVEGCRRLGQVHNHNHVEVSVNDGLSDVENVNLVLGQIGTYGCDDAYVVLTYNGDDGSCHGVVHCRIICRLEVIEIDLFLGSLMFLFSFLLALGFLLVGRTLLLFSRLADRFAVLIQDDLFVRDDSCAVGA